MTWETKRFGDVCEFVRGPFGGALKKNIFKEDGYAVYEQQHAIYNQFDSVRYFVDEDKFSEMGRFELFPNDLIMSCSGTMGKIAIVPSGIKQGIINQALLKLTPNKNLSPQFLKLWMESRNFQEQIESLSQGAAIKNMASVKILKEIMVPTPSEEEQKRIVAILDQVFTDIEQARAKTEKNLRNARELFESYLQQVFSQRGDGWVEKPMSQLFKIKHGYAFKSEDFITDYEGDKPKVLTPGNYSEYGDLYFTTKNTKRCISEYPSDFLFKRNDLTIVMTDLSSKMKILGKPAFIKEDNVLHNQRIGKFEFLTNDVKKEFLYYFLLSGLSLKNIHSSATGATVRHTAPSRILNINIPYPASIVEQSRLADALDEVNLETKRLEDIYKAKLLQLDELKRSILQKAFSGELTKTLEVDTNKGAVA